MINNYLKILMNWSDFDSRTSRKTYWNFVLVDIIITLIFIVLTLITFLRMLTFLGMLILIIECIYGLVILIPRLSAGVRRLHDIGKSGYYILWSLIPILGKIYLLYLYVVEGEKKKNDYGDVPLDVKKRSD